MKYFALFCSITILYSCSINRNIEHNEEYYSPHKNITITFLNDTVCRVQRRCGLATFTAYGSYKTNRLNLKINLKALTNYEKVKIEISDSIEYRCVHFIFLNHYGQTIFPTVIKYVRSDSMYHPDWLQVPTNKYLICEETDSIRVNYLLAKPFTIALADSMRGKKIIVSMPDDNLYTLNDRGSISIWDLRRLKIKE